jgi:hypothetical protein
MGSSGVTPSVLTAAFAGSTLGVSVLRTTVLSQSYRGDAKHSEDGDAHYD